jgi:nickel-dependent lactate racemase
MFRKPDISHDHHEICALSDRYVIDVIEPDYPAPVINMDLAIRQGLDKPINSPAIPDLVSQQSQVLLLIDDWTRETPRKLIVEHILRDLEKANVRPEKVEFLIASGTHCDRELNYFEIAPPWNTCKHHYHDCHRRDDLVFFGVSSLGTPIWLNRRVADADVIIGVGNITPHVFCGFSGGAKIIAPGVAGNETIVANHGMMISPRCRTGLIERNPARDDIEEIAMIAGLTFVANSIIGNDRKPLGFVAGDPFQAHRRGIEVFNKHYCISDYGKADSVIVGASAGIQDYFSKASRALCDVREFVRPGGTIFLLSDCASGWGSEEAIHSNLIPSMDMLSLEYEEIVSRIAARDSDLRILLQLLWIKDILKYNSLVIVSKHLSHEDFSIYGISVKDDLGIVGNMISQNLPSGSHINYIPHCDQIYPLRKF